jgi:hypothetical protein
MILERADKDACSPVYLVCEDQVTLLKGLVEQKVPANMISASFSFDSFKKKVLSLPLIVAVILNVLVNLSSCWYGGVHMKIFGRGMTYPLLPWDFIVVEEGSIESAFAIAGSSFGAILLND